MSTKQYDLVVLGGGTGGYVAAIRAAQLGKKVAIVEQDKLGGTCLHKGCIPSKAYLRSAEVMATVKESGTYGVVSSDVQLDFSQVVSRKDNIVEQLHTGIQLLINKNKIDFYEGKGRLIGPSIFSPKSGGIAIEREDDDEGENLAPDHVIIATGSRPRMLPGWEADGKHIFTSDEAFQMTSLPESLIIVGGGVIGVEWASMMCDFGVSVTLVEVEDRLIPTEDAALSKELMQSLQARGVQVLTGTKVLPESKSIADGRVSLTVQDHETDRTLDADHVLVSIGRLPNVEGLGLENTDVQASAEGIQVNSFMQTTEPHIYAIGDCNGGLQLAHAASHQGILAVEHLAGLSVQPYDPHLVPRCIYTRPEIAAIGLTEEQAKSAGYQVKTGLFPLRANGKALVAGAADGFVSVVADQQTNDILGVHLIGAHATELIAEAALAKILDATPWEIGQVIHPHPTLSEAIGEAMLAVDKNAIGI